MNEFLLIEQLTGVLMNCCAKSSVFAREQLQLIISKHNLTNPMNDSSNSVDRENRLSSQLSMCSQLSISQTSFQSENLDLQQMDVPYKQQLELTIIIHGTEYELYNVNQYQVVRLMRNYIRSGYFDENLRLNDIEIRWGYCNKLPQQEYQLMNYQDKVEEVMKKAGVNNSNQIYFRFMDRSQQRESHSSSKEGEELDTQQTTNDRHSELTNSNDDRPNSRDCKETENENCFKKCKPANENATVTVKLAEKVLKKIKQNTKIKQLLELLKQDNVPETLIFRIQDLANTLRTQTQIRKSLQLFVKQILLVLQKDGSGEKEGYEQQDGGNVTDRAYEKPEDNDLNHNQLTLKLPMLISEIELIKQKAQSSDRILEQLRQRIILKETQITELSKIKTQQQNAQLKITTITFKTPNFQAQTLEVFGLSHKVSFVDKLTRKVLQNTKESSQYLIETLQKFMEAKLTESQCVLNLDLLTVNENVKVSDIVLNTAKLFLTGRSQKEMTGVNLLMVLSLENYIFSVFSNEGSTLNISARRDNKPRSDEILSSKKVDLLIELNRRITFPISNPHSGKPVVLVEQSTINNMLLRVNGAFSIKMRTPNKIYLKTEEKLGNRHLEGQFPEIFSTHSDNEFPLHSLQIFKMKFEGALEKKLQSDAIISQ